jgi:hypothetical protein
MYAYASGHSPTLRTVVMVEETLKSAEGPMRVADIKSALPRKVMHNTLLQILDYLQAGGKVVIGTKGVLWVYTPSEELKRLSAKGLEI